MNFQDLLKAKIEKDGPLIAKHWGDDLRHHKRMREIEKENPGIPIRFIHTVYLPEKDADGNLIQYLPDMTLNDLDMLNHFYRTKRKMHLETPMGINVYLFEQDKEKVSAAFRLNAPYLIVTSIVQ